MSYPQQNQAWMYGYTHNTFPNTNQNMQFQPNTQDDAIQNSAFPMPMYTNLATIQNQNLSPEIAAQLQATMGPDSITRWAQEGVEGPFNNLKDRITSAPLHLDTVFAHQTYRNRGASDAASSNAGPDSGYGTRPLHLFTAGDEPTAYNKDCLQLEKVFKKMKPPRKTRSRASSYRNPPNAKSETKSACRQSVGEDSGGMDLVCHTPNCGQSFKTPSEMRKHRLWHDRPFKCSITECKMFTNGFTTKNDLERHKITKHHIFSVPTKAWSCAALDCKSKARHWLRLDNFRHHIQKAHTEDDEEIKRIIANSETIFQPTTLPSQESQGNSGVTPEFFADADEYSGLQPMDTYEASEYEMTFEEQFSAGSNGALGDTSDTFGAVNDSQSSYPLPTDALTSSFGPSSLGQGISPTAFSPGNGLNNSQFISSSFSAPASSWAGNAPINTTLTRDQQEAPRKSSATSNPSVVIHQAESDSQQNFLRSQLEAVMRKDLTEVKLHVHVSNLLQQHAQQLPPGSLPSYHTTPSGGSLSPARGRNLISGGRSAYITHGDGRKEERARSQMSDHSQSSNARGRSLKQDNQSPARQLTCPHADCEKTFQRPSALDKHIRRHEKPYACTFDACPCSKIFGSKNDWKRHESSQHMQQDRWRCEECYEAFADKRTFATHLQQQHGFSDDRATLAEHCRARRIGVNHSGSFWCGFCRAIVPLDANKRGVAAWDERFNHIAAHFVPDREHAAEQRRIEDWLPPNGKMTKGERERNGITGDAEAHGAGEAHAAAQPADSASSYALPGGSQELERADGMRRMSSTKRRRIKYIKCCQCGYDSPDLHVACQGCEKLFCDACERTHVRLNDDAENA